MMRRGFTLLELMVCTTIGTIVFAAVGAFYLEVRVGAAHTEAAVSMTRDASLALEWISRDAVGADRIEPSDRGATIFRGTAQIRWQIAERGLLRIEEAKQRIIAPRATALAVEEVPNGHRFQLISERKLIRGRSAKIVRSVFVARRR